MYNFGAFKEILKTCRMGTYWLKEKTFIHDYSCLKEMFLRILLHPYKFREMIKGLIININNYYDNSHIVIDYYHYSGNINSSYFKENASQFVENWTISSILHA